MGNYHKLTDGSSLPSQLFSTSRQSNWKVGHLRLFCQKGKTRVMYLNTWSCHHCPNLPNLLDNVGWVLMSDVRFAFAYFSRKAKPFFY